MSARAACPGSKVLTGAAELLLDIEGRRVLVTASTPIGARSESVKRVTDVAEAITFVKPAP